MSSGGNDDSGASPSSSWNPTVFWSVNAFILFMLLAACLSCRYGGKYLLIITRQAADHNARQNSDQQIQEGICQFPDR
jgi:hypothetical protein